MCHKARAVSCRVTLRRLWQCCYRAKKDRVLPDQINANLVKCKSRENMFGILSVRELELKSCDNMKAGGSSSSLKVPGAVHECLICATRMNW